MLILTRTYLLHRGRKTNGTSGSFKPVVSVGGPTGKLIAKVTRIVPAVGPQRFQYGYY